MYKLISDKNGARRGEFQTNRGTVQTPAFMNVATCGAIKGAVSAEVCAPVGGKAILAVYDATSKALVAVGSADLTAGALGKTVTASSEAIKADGSYEIKLFLWKDYSNLEPVYEAVVLD